MEPIDTIRVIVAALLVLVQASTSPESGTPTPEPEWSQRFGSAFIAPITQLNLPSASDSLEAMQGVMRTLNQRAASVNRRATTGVVSGLDLAQKVPGGVLRAGEDVASEFLSARHVSHVRSVRNFPELAAELDNLVIEHKDLNLARGRRDMGSLEQWKTRLGNAVTGVNAERIGLLSRTGKGCSVGGLVEFPVVGFEKGADVYYNRAELGAAVASGFRSVAISTGIGCVVTGVALLGLSAAGVTLSTPMIVTIAVIGGVPVVLIAGHRFWSALEDEDRIYVMDLLASAYDTVLDRVGTTNIRISTISALVQQDFRQALAASYRWRQINLRIQDAIGRG